MKRGKVTGKRILIINADDLGYARGINQAIQECCVAGILRSATLMANATAFDHAVAMVRSNPELDVGVHLVLTKMPPLAPPAKIHGLVEENGCLPGGPWDLLLSVRRGRIGRDAIRQELSCQIGKVLDHGLRPTHLDSHKHVHLIPEVLEVVIELARKFSIPWIRNPFDETPFFPPALQVDHERFTTFCAQHLKGRLVRYFRNSFKSQVERSGVRVPDHFFGVSLTGIWNEEAMIGLMRNLPPGITEWMLHPGTCDEDLLRSTTRLRERRAVEKALLLTPEMQKHLDRQGITLSSFRAEVA